MNGTRGNASVESVPGHHSSPGSESGARESNDIVVFRTRHEGKCVDCGEEFFRGSLIRVEDGKTFCLNCADLGHLEFLPRGNTALTRRATKYSALRAVVVEWSRTRQRYERQGILASPSAIARAETDCEADADVRERRRLRAAEVRQADEVEREQAFAIAIRAQFPGCPAGEPERIAAWTCRKYSGRVGRSAAGREFEPSAIRLAVIAAMRHEHTNYDELLMRGLDRSDARHMIAPTIDRLLAQWSAPAS